MKRILYLRNQFQVDLEKKCFANNIPLSSLLKLLEIEKTKKLLRRNALVQAGIDKEIEKLIEDENR